MLAALMSWIGRPSEEIVRSGSILGTLPLGDSTTAEVVRMSSTSSEAHKTTPKRLSFQAFSYISRAWSTADEWDFAQTRVLSSVLRVGTPFVAISLR